MRTRFALALTLLLLMTMVSPTVVANGASYVLPDKLAKLVPMPQADAVCATVNEPPKLPDVQASGPCGTWTPVRVTVTEHGIFVEVLPGKCEKVPLVTPCVQTWINYPEQVRWGVESDEDSTTVYLKVNGHRCLPNVPTQPCLEATVPVRLLP